MTHGDILIFLKIFVKSLYVLDATIFYFYDS